MTQETERLSPRQVRERLRAADGDLILLDVRRAYELRLEGIIPGATWIPMEELAYRAREELPQSADIIVYCAHGVRSEAVVAALARAGYTAVTDLAGGLAAWKAQGLPVEQHRQPS